MEISVHFLFYFDGSPIHVHHLLPEGVRHEEDLGHIPGPQKVADDVSSVLQISRHGHDLKHGL